MSSRPGPNQPRYDTRLCTQVHCGGWCAELEERNEARAGWSPRSTIRWRRAGL